MLPRSRTLEETHEMLRIQTAQTERARFILEEGKRRKLEMDKREWENESREQASRPVHITGLVTAAAESNFDVDSSLGANEDSPVLESPPSPPTEYDQELHLQWAEHVTDDPRLHSAAARKRIKAGKTYFDDMTCQHCGDSGEDCFLRSRTVMAGRLATISNGDFLRLQQSDTYHQPLDVPHACVNPVVGARNVLHDEKVNKIADEKEWVF